MPKVVFQDLDLSITKKLGTIKKNDLMKFLMSKTIERRTDKTLLYPIFFL